MTGASPTASPLDGIVFAHDVAHDPKAVTYSVLPALPTVLVVDDESSTQRVLDRLLALHRFTPLQAADVPEATTIAEREQVDAFIVDLTLGPGRSGLDMVGWVRRQQGYATAPVFVLTANLAISDDDRCLLQQHRAHVFYKGQSLELLIDCLQRILLQPQFE